MPGRSLPDCCTTRHTWQVVQKVIMPRDEKRRFNNCCSARRVPQQDTLVPSLCSALSPSKTHTTPPACWCPAGSALLLLTSHSECGAGVQVACFNTVAMRVRQCGIKAWPHRQHKHHRPHCVGIQMQAEVTSEWHPPMLRLLRARLHTAAPGISGWGGGRCLQQK